MEMESICGKREETATEKLQRLCQKHQKESYKRHLSTFEAIIKKYDVDDPDCTIIDLNTMKVIKNGTHSDFKPFGKILAENKLPRKTRKRIKKMKMLVRSQKISKEVAEPSMDAVPLSKKNIADVSLSNNNEVSGVDPVTESEHHPNYCKTLKKRSMQNEDSEAIIEPLMAAVTDSPSHELPKKSRRISMVPIQKGEKNPQGCKTNGRLQDISDHNMTSVSAPNYAEPNVTDNTSHDIPKKRRIRSIPVQISEKNPQEYKTSDNLQNIRNHDIEPVTSAPYSAEPLIAEVVDTTSHDVPKKRRIRSIPMQISEKNPKTSDNLENIKNHNMAPVSSVSYSAEPSMVDVTESTSHDIPKKRRIRFIPIQLSETNTQGHKTCDKLQDIHNHNITPVSSASYSAELPMGGVTNSTSHDLPKQRKICSIPMQISDKNSQGHKKSDKSQDVRDHNITPVCSTPPLDLFEKEITNKSLNAIPDGQRRDTNLNISPKKHFNNSSQLQCSSSDELKRIKHVKNSEANSVTPYKFAATNRYIGEELDSSLDASNEDHAETTTSKKSPNKSQVYSPDICPLSFIKRPQKKSDHNALHRRSKSMSISPNGSYINDESATSYSFVSVNQRSFEDSILGVHHLRKASKSLKKSTAHSHIYSPELCILSYI